MKKKEKEAYSFLSNSKYILGLFWSEKKSLLFHLVIGIIARVGLPFIIIYMPKVVIDEITAGSSPARFIAVVGIMTLLIALLGMLRGITNPVFDYTVTQRATGVIFPNLIAHKLTTMDYEVMESPDFKAVENKAEKATRFWGEPGTRFPVIIALTILNIAGLVLYSTVIAVIHPLILVLLIISAIVHWLMLERARKYERSVRDEIADNWTKLDYINAVFREKKYAKDLRLYIMPDWLCRIFDRDMDNYAKLGKTQLRKFMHAHIVEGLLILIRDGASYAFLIYLLFNGMQLGDFVFIFAAIGGFAGWVSASISQVGEIKRASTQISDFRTFLNFPDKANTGVGAKLPSFNKAPEIRLENVGYTYHGAEAPTLSDINITIKSGERIAIVGVNGAGKTTLISMICGLFHPKQGRITVDGTDITEFNRDEYFTLVSAVFQDIHMLTGSIACNVSQQSDENTDRERVAECLQKASLDMNKFSAGMDSLLVKEVNDNAIELSGGEKQKLALARALYKNAPIIILDEPTAALDPIAENEMYQQYAELTGVKTSLYISHRLASTRFCDRILFLDGGRIAEEGTHNELMAAGGKYAEMFTVQASYYQEDFQSDLQRGISDGK